MIHIVFINGNAGSGKDTLVTLLEPLHNVVHNISSIDCVRTLLDISKDDKRPETRKVLADVGASLEEYNEFRTNNTVSAVRRAIYRSDMHHKVLDGRRHVIFVHVREQAMMDRIHTKLLAHLSMFGAPQAVHFHRLLCLRPEATGETNNKADREAANAEQSSYNYILHNDGSLADLGGYKLSAFLAYLDSHDAPSD